MTYPPPRTTPDPLSIPFLVNTQAQASEPRGIRINDIQLPTRGNERPQCIVFTLLGAARYANRSPLLPFSSLSPYGLLGSHSVTLFVCCAGSSTATCRHRHQGHDGDGERRDGARRGHGRRDEHPGRRLGADGHEAVRAAHAAVALMPDA